MGRGSRALIGRAGCRSREGEGGARRYQEEATEDATDGPALRALARVGSAGMTQVGSTRLAANSPQTFPDHLPPSDCGLPSSAPLRPVTPGLSSALRRLGGVSPSPKLEETQLGREGVSLAPCILRLSHNRTQTGETPLQGNPETRSPFSLGRNGELGRGQEEWEKQLQAGLEAGALPVPPPPIP